MGFLSKLKSKLDKSIDKVSESINEKLGTSFGRDKEVVEETTLIEAKPIEREESVKVSEFLPVSETIVEKEPDTVTESAPIIEENKEEKAEEVLEEETIEPIIEEELIHEPIHEPEPIVTEKVEEVIEEPISEPAIEKEPEPISEPTIEKEPEPISEPEPIVEEDDEEPKKKGSFFGKLTEAFKLNKTKTGLTKTRRNFLQGFASIFGMGQKVTPEMLDQLEEMLITSDIGVDTTEFIIDELKARIKKEGYENAEDCYKIMKDILHEILIKSPSADNDKLFNIEESNKPYTILVVGVNGVGKTTTIGKLAHNYRAVGKEVVIGAADTFRAAANDQLEIWAERAGVQIVQQGLGADPAAVAYDTLNSAISKNKDVVIIDTAGRLHNKKNLMNELEKIGRVMRKLKDNAPDEVYLVLDATTGQNAIIQAQEFSKVTPITGIILTKLDGTAKGGVVIPIAHTLKVPVRYIGLGEGIDDLMPFDPTYFIEGMFSITDEDIEVIDG